MSDKKRPAKRRIPIAQRREIMLAVYEALRIFERGDDFGNSIAVGQLPTNLSAVYLYVEAVVERQGK